METEIKTVAGLTVKLLPVARVLTEQIRLGVLKEYEERGEVMTIPTYLVKTAAGETQEFPHDEETIKDAPAEDVEKWEKYHDAQRRFERDVSGKVTRFLLYRGVVVDSAEMDKSLQAQAAFGISIPSDEIERIVYYITTELLPTPLDIIRATQAIIILSMAGIEEETLRAVEESFRRALEKAGRPGAAAIKATEGPVVQSS